MEFVQNKNKLLFHLQCYIAKPIEENKRNFNQFDVLISHKWWWRLLIDNTLHIQGVQSFYNAASFFLGSMEE